MTRLAETPRRCGVASVVAVLMVACTQPPKLPPRPVEVATAECPDPRYPIEAIRSAAEGTTQVRFLVDADGKVSDGKVLQSSGDSPAHRALDEETLRVVNACRFAPAPGHGPRAATRSYRWQLSDEQAAVDRAVNAGLALPSSICTNYRSVMSSVSYPQAAIDLDLKKGDVLVEFTLTADGRTSNVRAIKSSHPAFAEAAIAVVSGFQCRSLGKTTLIQVPFSFVMED